MKTMKLENSITLSAEEQAKQGFEALEKGEHETALVHLYASALLNGIIKSATSSDSEKEQYKILLKDNVDKFCVPFVKTSPYDKNESKEAEQLQASKEEIIANATPDSREASSYKTSHRFKLGTYWATMYFSPIKGDDRYVFKNGDGARFLCVRDSDIKGVCGKSYSFKVRGTSYYYRAKEAYNVAHRVFNIMDEKDPQLGHFNRVIMTAMKKAQSKFMKGYENGQ